MRHTQRWVTSAIGVAGILMWVAGCGALVTSTPPIQATGSTAVVKPYPTPSAAHMLYRNELTGATAGWASGQQCTFTSSGLVVHPNGGQAYICLAPLAPHADLAITVLSRQQSGSTTHAYGIVLRHATPHNYYFFGIDGHGHFTFTVVVNDVNRTIIPFTASSAIHTGNNAENQLQVIAKGQVMTLLVNGTTVGQVTLATFPNGGIGLRGINDGIVVFRQLAVQQV